MKPFNSKKTAAAKLLFPLWWALGKVIHRPIYPQQPDSILILDLHLVGDIVLLTPLLRRIREQYPKAQITLIAGPWAQDILTGTDWVNEIISFKAPWVKSGQGWYGLKQCTTLIRQLRRRVWHLGVEVRGDIRQILLLTLAGVQRRVGYGFTGGASLLTDVIPDNGLMAPIVEHHRRIAEYLNIWPKNEPYLPVLQLTQKELDIIQQQQRYYGLHFGASMPLRRLPIEEARRFIQKLAETSHFPLILFVPAEDATDAKQLYETLPDHLKPGIRLWSGTLRKMIVLLSRAVHIFCMDSGVAHIAAALNIPVTVIYGPACSTYVRPIGPHVTIIERNDLSCKPCDQRHCTNKQRQLCLAGLVDTISLPPLSSNQYGLPKNQR